VVAAECWLRAVLSRQPAPTVVMVCVGTVPAKIVASLSSDDVTVQEGASVSLVCHVTGVPRPEVTWRRKWSMLLESTELPAHESLIGGQREYSTCRLMKGLSVHCLCLFPHSVKYVVIILSTLDIHNVLNCIVKCRFFTYDVELDYVL